VRAGTGTPVQQTNCHPFRYRNWLFVHNGYVAGYDRLRRDLLMAVRPELFRNIAGSTDSELLFHLALTSVSPMIRSPGSPGWQVLSKRSPPRPTWVNPRSR
jgi:predicted glutamine amidotransferase